MLTREDILRFFEQVVRFGSIKSSKLDGNKGLACTVQGIAGESSSDDNEVFGAAPLLYKPQNGAECVFLQIGDQKVILATRDKRWQIECAAGEVILRAMVSGSPAYLKLKPDGTAELHAVQVHLAGTAGEVVALGNKCNAEFAAISAVLGTLCGSLGITPIPYTFPGTAPAGVAPFRSCAAAKTMAE